MNKQEYFAKLRADWKAAKAELGPDKETQIKNLIKKHGLSISPMGFFFTELAMRIAGLDGLPYIDAKTFNGWKAHGFKVKKGEKSFGKGITWIHPKNKDGEEDTDYCYPKAYHLFHRSQVEPR